jgi:hypothetical protein
MKPVMRLLVDTETQLCVVPHQTCLKAAGVVSADAGAQGVLGAQGLNRDERAQLPP